MQAERYVLVANVKIIWTIQLQQAIIYHFCSSFSRMMEIYWKENMANSGLNSTAVHFLV